MRRPLKHYAIAFYEAVKTLHQAQSAGTGQAPGVKIPDVLSNFTKLLHRDGVLSKAEKIFSLFRAHWNFSEKEVDITLTSAHPVSSAQQKHIGAVVKEVAGAENYTIDRRNDPALLGGAIVQYDDTVLDGSVRQQLSKIKTALQA